MLYRAQSCNARTPLFTIGRGVPRTGRRRLAKVSLTVCRAGEDKGGLNAPLAAACHPCEFSAALDQRSQT
jgi:hypothetical protein